MNEKYNKIYYKFNNQNRDRLGNLFYFNLIKYNFDFQSLLDFGCGVGFFLKRVEKIAKIKNSCGLEINNFALNEARKNTKKSKIFIKIEDIDKKFDLITMLHVVEHLDDVDLRNVLQKIKKLLNDKGKILISTPAKNALANRIKKNKWIGFKDPTHINLKSIDEWKNFYNQNQLNVLKVTNDGLWDFPYKKIYFSFQFMKILFYMLIQIFVGKIMLKHDEGETFIFILEKAK